MAITLDTSPANIVSPYRQVLWDVTSDRFGSEVELVSLISSAGGFADYTVVSHPYLVGDVVLPAVTSLDLNVRQTVTAVGATSIVTDQPFLGSGIGIIRRSNDEFQIKGELYANIDFDENGEPLKTITLISDDSGEIKVDVVGHGYVVGDFVELSGTTSYNDIYVVSFVADLNSFRVAVAFVADEAGQTQKLSLIGSKAQKAIALNGVDTFRFDFQDLLQSIVSFDLIPIGASSIISPNQLSINEYVVKFIEQYNDADGFLQDKDELIGTLGEKSVVNATLQHIEVQDLTKYTQDTVAKQFLTNMPLDKELASRDEHVMLAFLTNESQLKTELREFTDVGGLSIVNGAVTDIVNNRGVIIIDVSSLLSTTVRFQMRLLTNANVIRSESIQWFIDEKCYPDGFLQLLFPVLFPVFTVVWHGILLLVQSQRYKKTPMN